MKKGKLFGQEFELDLERLESSAAAAKSEVESLPAQQGPVEASTAEDADIVIRRILQQAATAPKVALMTLASELEKRARHALATRGLWNNRPGVSVPEALMELNQYGFPANLSGSLKLFEDIRNKVIHTAAADDDVLRALDSGITILRALAALPNEVNKVHHPGVAIFSDPLCSNEITDAKGVMLETVSPGGVMKSLRIFPTTLIHFQKGKQVALEWNMGKVWGEAWYRDPDDGHIHYAWKEAAEFTGRHLENL